MSDREPILVEREKTHGDFQQVASLSLGIKQLIRKAYNIAKEEPMNAAHAESLDMIATKIARIICGNPNEPDHWRDLAGYAKLGEEACK